MLNVYVRVAVPPVPSSAVIVSVWDPLESFTHSAAVTLKEYSCPLVTVCVRFTVSSIFSVTVSVCPLSTSVTVYACENAPSFSPRLAFAPLIVGGVLWITARAGLVVYVDSAPLLSYALTRYATLCQLTLAVSVYVRLIPL